MNHSGELNKTAIRNHNIVEDRMAACNLQVGKSYNGIGNGWKSHPIEVESVFSDESSPAQIKT